jgi:type IV fimbrial biogenesis protein FimT
MTSLARPARSAGFTLLEIMITIGIAGILLAIAVPSFRSLTYSNRIIAQATDMVGAMNIARSEAIKRNGTISFCRVSTATATACVTTAGTWGNWVVRTAGGTVIRRGTLDSYGSTVTVKSTLSQDTLAFGSDGLARTPGGALITSNDITVCTTKLTKDYLKIITVGRGSRISMAPGTGACP